MVSWHLLRDSGVLTSVVWWQCSDICDGSVLTSVMWWQCSDICCVIAVFWHLLCDSSVLTVGQGFSLHTLLCSLSLLQNAIDMYFQDFHTSWFYFITAYFYSVHKTIILMLLICTHGIIFYERYCIVCVSVWLQLTICIAYKEEILMLLNYVVDIVSTFVRVIAHFWCFSFWDMEVIQQLSISDTNFEVGT